MLQSQSESGKSVQNCLTTHTTLITIDVCEGFRVATHAILSVAVAQDLKFRGLCDANFLSIVS